MRVKPSPSSPVGAVIPLRSKSPGVSKPAMPGSLRQDLRRFTSEKLVSAALVSFAEFGFRATTVERIVELAGTTAPTFYRHFAGKNDLLYELREYLTAEVRKTVIKLHGEPSKSRAGVRAWLEDYVTMWQSMHRLCAAMWEASNEDSYFAEQVLPETIGVAECGLLFYDTLNEVQQERIKIRLAMLILFLDRAVGLAKAQKNEAVSQALLDEVSDILWMTVFSPNRFQGDA